MCNRHVQRIPLDWCLTMKGLGMVPALNTPLCRKPVWRPCSCAFGQEVEVQHQLSGWRPAATPGWPGPSSDRSTPRYWGLGRSVPLWKRGGGSSWLHCAGGLQFLTLSSSASAVSSWWHASLQQIFFSSVISVTRFYCFIAWLWLSGHSDLSAFQSKPLCIILLVKCRYYTECSTRLLISC